MQKIIFFTLYEEEKYMHSEKNLKNNTLSLKKILNQIYNHFYTERNNFLFI